MLPSNGPLVSFGGSLKREPQLRRHFRLSRFQDDSETPSRRIPFRGGKIGQEKQIDHFLQIANLRQSRRNRLASGDLAEVDIFDFERHRLRANFVGIAVAPDLFDQRLKPFARGFVEMDVLRECVFGAD